MDEILKQISVISQDFFVSCLYNEECNEQEFAKQRSQIDLFIQNQEILLKNLNSKLQTHITETTKIESSWMIEILYHRSIFNHLGVLWSSELICQSSDLFFRLMREKQNKTEHDLFSQYKLQLLDKIQEEVNVFTSKAKTIHDPYPTWVNGTATPKYSLSYLISHLREEDCDEHMLLRIMGYSLEMLDDFQEKNKVLALKNFHHFMKKAANSKNEINANLIETIFFQLQKAIVYRELNVVAVLYPTILLYFFQLPDTLQAKHATGLFCDFLPDLERSCTAAFRRIYIENTKVLVSRMRLQVLPFLQRFVRILNSYLHWPDDKIRNCTFDIMEEILKFAWCRMAAYYEVLLPAFAEVSEGIINENGRKSPYIERIAIICVLLYFACPDSDTYKHKFMEQLEKGKEENKNWGCVVDQIKERITQKNIKRSAQQ